MAIFTTRQTLTSLFTRIRSSPSPLTSSLRVPIRLNSSGSGYDPFNDPSSDCNEPHPGCDHEHWLIVMELPPDPKPSEHEMIDSFVKTLATVLDSEEEAKKKIYSVWTTINHPSFGALISEELSKKIEGLPGVMCALPDSYYDVPNRDYGGDLFIDGKVIPRPQFRPSFKTSHDSNSQVFKGFSWNNFLP